MDEEDVEVAWLKNQFDPKEHVPKGTAIKIQVRQNPGVCPAHSDEVCVLGRMPRRIVPRRTR